MSNNGFDFSPYTIRLNTDIDLNGKDWIPFTNYGGVFDGQGHTISNGNIKASDSDGTGFFGRLNKVTTIKDLVFKKMTTRSDTFLKLAIVAGANSANGTTFKNVDLYNCFVTGNTVYVANAGGFYLCDSTGAIKIEDCDVYFGVYQSKQSNGIAAFINGEYQSKIVNCNVVGTFLISSYAPGVFIGNGNDNTVVENCHSDLYPTEIISISGIENEFTDEQKQLIADNASTLARGIAYTCHYKSVNSGALLESATLDSTDISSNLLNADTYVDVNSFNSFSIKFGTADEIVVTVDGNAQTLAANEFSTTLNEGVHDISVVLKKGSFRKAYKLLVGFDKLFAIYDSNGNTVAQKGLTAHVDSYASGYTLKQIATSQYVSFTVNGSAIASDGVALTNRGGDLGYFITISATYNGVKYDISCSVLKYGVTISGNWNYNQDGAYFVSSNVGKDSTTSEMVFTVEPGVKLAFDYNWSSESNYDWFNIEAPGVTNVRQSGNDSYDTVQKVLAATNWQKYEYTNTSSSAVTVRVYFTKDGGASAGCDAGFVRNIAYESTSSQSLNKNNYAIASADSETVYTIPTDAVQLSEDLYYVIGGFKYENGIFANADSNAVITFYSKRDIFVFKYATESQKGIEASFDDGAKIAIANPYQDSSSAFNGESEGPHFSEYKYVFPTSGTHKIEIEFPEYSWYCCRIKDIVVAQLLDYNIDLEIEGNGTVSDIAYLNDIPYVSGYTKKTYDKLQFFGRTDVNSASEFVGYQIKNADGTWGELIKSNGDVLTVTGDMCLKFVFADRLPVENEISYSLITNGVATNGKLRNYEKITFDKVWSNTQLVLTAPIMNGVTAKVYDSIKGTEEELQIDNNVYFYTIDDVSASRTIKFIYEKEGYVTTEFVVYVSFEADINSYIIANGSKPIEVINDDELNYQYNSSLSTSERFAYASSLSKKDMFNSASNIGFRVQGQGVLVFDYYINSEDRGETESSGTLHTGDRALYGINTRITWDEVTNGYSINPAGYIKDSYKDRVGYLGAALGTVDFSKCQGQLGWQRVSIPVVASSDDEYNTVYIAYVKDWEDTIETEDTFAIANVMFVQGNFNVSFNTNTSTGSVSATANGSQITSGQSVGAGSLITLTATDSDSSARFVGWYNGEKLVSKNRTINFGLRNEINYQAVFANSQNPYVVNNKTFATLSDAVSSIGSKQGLVRLLANAQEDNINVPSNVTLLLVYSADDEEGLLVGGGNARVSWNCGVDPYVTLTVNGKLTLNGKLIVGGVQHKADQSAQGHTSGAYAQMIVNGSVEIANGGYLDVIGRVTGKGTITAVNGATLRQPFTVNNYAGGTNTYALYNANQFPFVQFATINVECKQIVNYGAKVIGSTSLYFWSSITTQDVVLVDKVENRTSEGEGALIWMHEGSSLKISYDSTRRIDAEVGAKSGSKGIHLGDFGVTTIDVYGNITAGEFSLQGYGSGEMVLAIPYTYNFNIKNGATVTIDHAYKVMPGAIVTIENGATVNITENGKLYVYDGLYQSSKDGKRYPYYDELEGYGFAKSGMLIVNGTLNINGTFAGIAQTVEGGEINVGANANVANQTIVEGCNDGYDYNMATFDMSGRVYGVNGFVNLEKGKTYRTFANNAFTLNSFTNKYWVGRKDSCSEQEFTLTRNQAMQGRFAEWNGQKFVLTLTFYIGTEQADVIVNVNGSDCKTDLNGKFTCTVEVANATDSIKYYTKNVYTAEKSQTLVLDQEMQTLTHVASGVALYNDNVYTRVYDKDGGLVQNFKLLATVSFYGTTDTENVALSFDESALNSSVYVNNGVALTNSSLVNSLSATLNVVGSDVAQFIDDVNNLKNADDIVKAASGLYATYGTLTSIGTGDDVTFIKNYLNDYIDFAGKVVKEIATTGSATYGDGEVNAQITYINGTTATATATLSDWRMDASRIVATATLVCDYQGAKYNVTNTCDGSKKEVALNAFTADSAVYDGNMHTVTATLSGLANFDNDTLVYATATFGNNAREYNVTLELAGEKAVFYTLTGNKTHTCTVSAKDITVTVNDAQAIKDKTETIVLVANASGNVDEITFTFAIYKGETLVATVGKDGKVTLADGQTLALGEYTVKAVTDNANYNIASQTAGTLKVVEANDYYNVDFNLGGTSKVYDGNVLAVNPIVKVKATGALVDASKYSVSVTGKGTQILEAGTYQIVVTLDGETIAQESFNVTAKDVTVTIKPQSSVYGEVISVDQTAYTASGVVGNDDLGITLAKADGRNAGKYDIVGAWNNHNYNVTFEGGKKAYEITAKAIVVEIENKESFYGEIDAVLSAKLKGSLAYTDSFDSLGIKLVRAAGKNAGTYAISLDSWTNGNYTIKAENATYTVKKLALRAIVANATSVYGDPLANLTFTTEGKFAEGESVDVLNAKLSIGNAKNAGTYAIEFAYDNANYDVNATKATYTITKREVTLRVLDATSVYGNPDAAFTVSITKGTMAEGEDAQSLVSITRAEGRNVGTYAITATKADNANYDVTLVYTGATNSVYTISKRPVTVTVKNADLPYTASWAELNSALRYESNVLAGDELNVRLFVLVGGVELTADNFESMFAGGTHVISASIDNDNYELSAVNGTLTVGLPVVSLTNEASGITRVYGDTQNVFNWRTMLTGYLASATDSTFRAVFYRASDLTTPVDIATAGAGAYKMQIEIVHATAYAFADGTSKSEFVDVTVEKKDLTESIVITLSGLTDGGYLVFSYGLSIDASVTDYDDVDILKVLTKDGESATEIDAVGAYEYTATIQSANYKGAKTLQFKVVNSAEGKIEDLKKYAEVEFLTRAQYAEAKALLDSVNEDDTLQINDDAEAKANYANVEALCANYAKVAANLDEIKVMLDAYAAGESKKLIEAHDYIVALDEEKLALVKQSEEGKAYQEAWQAARAEGAEATEIANKVRDNVLFGVVAAVSALLAMAYVAFGKFRV